LFSAVSDLVAQLQELLVAIAFAIFKLFFGVIRLFAAHCVFLQSVQAMQSFQRLKDPKHRSESATSVTFPNYSSSATSVSRKYCSKIDVIFPMTLMCFAVIVALLQLWSLQR